MGDRGRDCRVLFALPWAPFGTLVFPRLAAGLGEVEGLTIRANDTLEDEGVVLNPTTLRSRLDGGSGIGDGDRWWNREAGWRRGGDGGDVVDERAVGGAGVDGGRGDGRILSNSRMAGGDAHMVIGFRVRIISLIPCPSHSFTEFVVVAVAEGLEARCTCRPSIAKDFEVTLRSYVARVCELLDRPVLDDEAVRECDELVEVDVFHAGN